MLSLFALILALVACSSSDDNSDATVNIAYSPTEISETHEKAIVPLSITCQNEWMVYSDDTWIDCAKNTAASSTTADGDATATIAANPSHTAREGSIVIKSGSTRVSIPVTQAGKPEAPVDPSITVPEGYQLVWQDEFNDQSLSMPDENLWWYETGDHGWGNNEIQRYVEGKQGNEVIAEVSNGTLKIHAKRVGNEVLSARINTKESWKYGYFEGRMKLAKGKGTWPAFWMMPKNFTSWPDDGEIDIMEEVGYDPNVIHSSIHCKAYYHSIGTQKTATTRVPTAQTDFHVYAVEWTPDYIKGFVDGKEYFTFHNDKAGNKDTWPFNALFYLKLNLAWGGDWGGAQGIDESVLPATFEIDYVRVFQKK